MSFFGVKISLENRSWSNVDFGLEYFVNKLYIYCILCNLLIGYFFIISRVKTDSDTPSEGQ